MTEILIVDDDRDVAQTIKLALKRRNFGTQAAFSGLEAIRMLNHYRPDLIILDISMPGMDGFEVCRHIRKDRDVSELPIIFLTARSQDEDRIEGFRAGADDYLSKPFNLEELVLRVNAVLRRCQAIPLATGSARDRPGTLRVGSLELDTRTFTIKTPAKSALLTPTEFDLLHHLMAHTGQVFSSERLLHEVWGFPHSTGSTDLVRAHVKNLREKIELDPHNPVYLQTVQRHGYVVTVNGAAYDPQAEQQEVK